MWTYNYSDELCHFGVKGMKWGVIRDQLTSSSKAMETAGSKMEKHTASSKKTKEMNKKIKTMSDQELQAKVNRMNLESQYSKLSGENISAGKKRVSQVMTIAGSALAGAASAVGIVASIIAIKNGSA